MNSVTKDIIFIYLSGQATVIQKRMIQEWLQAPSNQEIFYEWLEEWESHHVQFTPNLESAYTSFQTKLATGGIVDEITPVDIAADSKKFSYRRFSKPLLVAASVFAIALILIFQLQGNDKTVSFHTAAAETRTFLLSDSTAVTLGPNSELEVLSSFENTKERNVHLNGQGIFHVKHTKDDKPFYVNTPSGLQVAVLGTEFDLLATKDSNRIYLSNGSVKLFLSDDKKDSIKMLPGDLVKVNNQKKVQIQSKQSYWQMGALQNHAMTFNETSLAEISLILKEQFGRKIKIADSSLSARTISGSYRWTSVEEFLQTLSEMMNFQVIKTDSEIVIK